MSASKFPHAGFFALGIGMLIVAASSGFAAEETAASTDTAPTKDAREKMALVHEQMAACLRSDKTLSECRTQMRQHCRDELGALGCKNMGMRMGMGMGGGIRGRLMQTPPPQ